jgi:hypothetical protein
MEDIRNTQQNHGSAFGSVGRDAGFEIIRDYRTANEPPVPVALSDLYTRDALLTEQIVRLLKTPAL